MTPIPTALPKEAHERIQADLAPLDLSDSTRVYRYQMSQIGQLSPGQVADLAQRIATVRESKSALRSAPKKWRRLTEMSQETQEAQEAKRQLVEANLRLVLCIARKYRGYGIELMDLVQEGNLGLMHAVEKFDHTMGYRFSTYAARWIKLYIAHAVAEQAHVIRLPIQKVEEIKKLGRIRQHLAEQASTGHEPSLEKVAEQMEMSIQEVVHLLASNQEVLSLDRPRQGGDDDVSLSEVLEDDPSYSPERVLMTQTLQAHIQELLNHLPLREKRVLELRYGLNGEEEHSLSQAGKRLGISHEAVRQIEFRALQKLDHPSRSRMLQDFLQ